MRSMVRAMMMVMVGGLVGGQAVAGKPEVYTGRSKVAVGGYDPVAYFTTGQPTKGKTSIVHQYKGATFRFASETNRSAFAAEPDKYAPQYGGYCAWAVAQGKTSKGSPKHWKIVDGKLYLNYNSGIQRRWASDIPGMISKGDANWPRVLDR